MLSYSLRVSGNNGWNPSGGDVFLVGNGQRLAAASGPPPGTSWQSRSVALDPSGGWRFNTLNGAVATDQEIRQVLENLTALEIRGEYFAGDDSADIDSVRMASPTPIPTMSPVGLTLLVLILMGLGMVWLRRTL